MPETEPTTLTVANIANGAAVELFEEELEHVLENMLDPNTDPKAKRVVTLKFTFVPNRDRDSADVKVEAASKLAPMHSGEGGIYMARQHGGKAVAVAHHPEQLKMYEEQKKAEVSAVQDAG